MSRKVHLEDDCTLRFPGRSDDFADGVEIGVLAAQMDFGMAPITRRIAAANLEQVRVLAAKLGYRVTVGAADGPWLAIELARRTERPRLRLVRA